MIRSILVLLLLGPSLQASTIVSAEVAGQRYVVPSALLPQDGIQPPPRGFTQTLRLQPVWSRMHPPPAQHRLGYADGLLDILLQDLSATTRVEALATLPDPRTRFLALWQNSTIDQFALSPGFRLASLVPEAGEAPPGLLRLGGIQGLRELILYADGRPEHLCILMMCQSGLSCQLWWMRGDSAVQVTLAAQFLPDWADIRQQTTALLDGMSAGPR